MTLTLSLLFLSVSSIFRLCRGNLRLQHPRAGGSVRGSGAERYVWRGPAEGPRPGGLRAAEGVHLHHPGPRLRLRPGGHGGQEVTQVSETSLLQKQQRRRKSARIHKRMRGLSVHTRCHDRRSGSLVQRRYERKNSINRIFHYSYFFFLKKCFQ